MLKRFSFLFLFLAVFLAGILNIAFPCLAVEGPAGFQYMAFDDENGINNDSIPAFRNSIQKQFKDGVKLSLDVSLYPSFADFGEYQFNAKASITKKITKNSLWKISVLNDFNSDPNGTTEKQDYRFIAGVEITF